jgi:FKBP-type peptidyl-prolyl cis-trans isomerase FkpA
MQVTSLRPSLIKRLAVVALCAFAAGCSTYSEEDKESFDGKIGRYIAEKNWKLEKSSSGLYVQVLNDGDGDEPIISGSEVTLDYKGTLLNGTVFDQTPPGKPLKSELKGLIMGFREGLLGHTKGAKVRMIVPPQLGYGDMSLPKIPANSVLVGRNRFRSLFLQLPADTETERV